MHVNIISSLEKHNQFGGAALRCRVFDYIYNKLNLSSTHFFQNKITKFHTLKSIAQTLYYGRETISIFKKAKINLDRPGLLHLDNLRHLSWFFTKHKPSRIIFNAHNLEYENYFGRIKSKAANRFKHYEISILKNVDLICVCSKREQQEIISLQPKLEQKIIVIPNLVDKEKYYCSKQKKTISFIGTLHYFPNIEAVHYLCDHFIKSLSKDLLSKYRFVIAGRDPQPELVKKIENSPFELICNPSDEEVKTIFADSLIQLVPIESGSGTRIKISESIFSGSHVLSTPLGREGLESPLIHEANLNEFPELFSHIVDKLESPEKQIEIFAKNHDLKGWTDNNLQLLKNKMLGTL